MPKYQVRSGQNIYDVAMSIHGSIEGIFDLLASNSQLTMESKLESGMELNYHDELVIDKNIPIWFKDNNVIVKNGEHIYHHNDIDEFVRQHIQSHHKELYLDINALSPDEQSVFWETLRGPRMVIRQQGQLSTIRLRLKPNKHLIIDWGDYSDPQICEGSDEQEIDHCYEGSDTHTIVFYGDFDFFELDLSEVNGVHYPLDIIYADKFKTLVTSDDLNKLIVTQ